MIRYAVPAFAMLLTSVPLVAQTTGPSFNAPYRAFVRSEIGGTLSFPDGGGTIIEGQYRFGYRTFDIGVRGGAFFPGGGGSESIVLGAIARNRVLTHTESFPLDGALVFGLGLDINGGTDWAAPVGLSLGRRLNLEGSDVSIVPYVQPTGYLFEDAAGDVDFDLGLGFGADFRLSSLFDARVSIGVGNRNKGIAFSAVWVH